MFHYNYTHCSTEATTGYFSCIPSPLPSLQDALRYLAEHPLDDFMRQNILTRMRACVETEIESVCMKTFPVFPGAIQALVEELTLLGYISRETAMRLRGGPREIDATSPNTSLPYLASMALPDHTLHSQWNNFFSLNQKQHKVIKVPADMEKPYNEDEVAKEIRPTLNDLSSFSYVPYEATKYEVPSTHPVFFASFPVSISSIHAQYAKTVTQPVSVDDDAVERTIQSASERLLDAAIISGMEMRHTASLSPVALLRPWNVRMTIAQRRHKYTVSGQATTYGRGLSISTARVSCIMEMVERASAYLSITNDQVNDRLTFTPVRVSTRSNLLREGCLALDPNEFPVEVPYKNSELTWILGWFPDQNGGTSPIYVPVQMAGLFCNLDEIALCEAPGSTGLATGKDIDGAKLSALLEVFERDAEATNIFDKSRCFTLEADEEEDPVLCALLADYKTRGINIQFQDCSGTSGVPVYKCFVMDQKGTVHTGFGAGLSGKKAIISAITETPFPYPDGGPSGPMLRRLPVKDFSDLPDYELPDRGLNVTMLEKLLLESGRPPIYVDLTHKVLQFPVIRCCIPGMELNNDRGEFSRIPPRLYINYLNHIKSLL